MNLYICIMAGGLGKRMKSSLPKVLHPVQGIPMIVRVIKQALLMKPIKILIIVGEYMKIIKTTIEEYLPQEAYSRLEYVIQPIALGTGHAMQCTVPVLNKYLNSDPVLISSTINAQNSKLYETSWVLILSGDVPLIGLETLNDFLSEIKYGMDGILVGTDKITTETNKVSSTYKIQRDEAKTNTVQAVLMTQILDDPHGKGRVFTTSAGEFDRIVEERRLYPGRSQNANM